MSTAKKWGVHLTWAKSMSWQIFVLTQHLSVIVAHIPQDHRSISIFMILKLVLWHWVGILQVHIQNFNIKN